MLATPCYIFLISKECVWSLCWFFFALLSVKWKAVVFWKVAKCSLFVNACRDFVIYFITNSTAVIRVIIAERYFYLWFLIVTLVTVVALAIMFIMQLRFPSHVSMYRLMAATIFVKFLEFAFARFYLSIHRFAVSSPWDEIQAEGVIRAEKSEVP